MYLVYDTETTGFPEYRKPSDDDCQPHIVQLAAALLDPASLQIVNSMNMIVKPEDWEIPAEAAETHGITTERATEVGLFECDVMEAFYSLYGRCSARVGHNDPFDARIIRIAGKRFLNHMDTFHDHWKSELPKHCTMRLSTPIVNLPPTEKMLAAGRKHAKSPTLSEAYLHFTGEELIGAHDAWADVQATITVFRALRNEGAV